MISQVAENIETLRASLPPNATIKGMVGDVAYAYRHLSASCSDASWFVLTVPEAGVIGIDMSAPFGWCGSLNIYCAFGNGLVAHESPSTIHPTSAPDKRTFWGFNYIDDHVLIEHDNADRLDYADIALYLAMMATLEQNSLNLYKFTQWSTDLHAVGLHWDLLYHLASSPCHKTKSIKQYQESTRC
ncbi:hypothetical protein DYB28_008929 [Aphanomyces astaci]|uniref:Uncharacterized protein n=1 Tax=Aphanomyces astaci TaxID=112090 RepID=A0A9X8E4S9_APHAT|nr:hypothetical protein DYB28_008929 [Aphanomyces astaci]